MTCKTNFLMSYGFKVGKNWKLFLFHFIFHDSETILWTTFSMSVPTLVVASNKSDSYRLAFLISFSVSNMLCRTNDIMVEDIEESKHDYEQKKIPGTFCVTWRCLFRFINFYFIRFYSCMSRNANVREFDNDNHFQCRLKNIFAQNFELWNLFFVF